MPQSSCLITGELVALVLSNGGENASAGGVSVEHLDNTPLLVVLREQVDVAVSEGLSDNDGCLSRIEVACATLPTGQGAENGRSVTACYSRKVD